MLYDIAAQPELRERMTFTSPKTGAPVHRGWQIPQNHADLRARRLFSETWAEATFGLMGRAPDHVAGFFCRLCGQSAILRQRRATAIRRQSRRLLRIHARQPRLLLIRDRAAADRPLEARAQAERSDALCRRGQGARRRHRHFRRAAIGDRRRDFRLSALELHPAAGAGRRELRQLPRRADRRRKA